MPKYLTPPRKYEKAPETLEVRELEREEIAQLEIVRQEATSSPSFPATNIKQIRSSHHNLAMLIAAGKSYHEAAFISGFGAQYIQRLEKFDPAFKELVAYYQAHKERIFIDTFERVKAVGTDALEVLQQRLEDDPTAFSKGELMDMVDSFLVKPITAKQVASSGGKNTPPIAVQVNFVSSKDDRLKQLTSNSRLLEGELE